LACLVVILDVVDLTLLVNPLISVRAVSIHVSKSVGSSTVREQNGNLVK
jgi:hypothetical protein